MICRHRAGAAGKLFVPPQRRSYGVTPPSFPVIIKRQPLSGQAFRSITRIMKTRIASGSLAALLASAALANPAIATGKPVKVYILSGQSNMVGIGQVTGSDSRWGKEFTDTVLSMYEGSPDAAADYDKLNPVKTIPMAELGK